ncbi:T9SS type B sorting domain-containing protein [Flavobacterium sp. LB2R40]|uniref:T9SS type B sorting domain-containing protein n=1 Tax=Flavobacterium sp. LB2R40 TaxID=3401722 RepID=UPI003AAF2989
MKKTLLLLFILFSISCFSQFSKTHYIPPLTCATNLAGDHYLYISTPSTTDVNFKIIANGGSIITGVVKNTTPYIYSIGQGQNTQLITPKNTIGILTNKGYVIEAEDLIYVSVRVNAGLNVNNGSYVHAGGLVSKGNSALGKEFRLGAMLNPVFDTNVLNFASILSTENGTKVTISNIPIGTLLTNGYVISGPITFILDKNESYVLALENNNTTVSNSSKMIGALVESDKPVVVNSGSFGGSNSTSVNAQGSPNGRDVGFDQIVPIEKTGKEYIFVKGLGSGSNEEIERVLLIANKAQTIIYLNDGLTPFATLANAGDYITIDGSKFMNGNLYVKTSENVFAYQSIGGSNSPANQNLFFVPPLNCSTPRIVDNIPSIESIGNIIYNGGLNIVTETGATVTINNTTITSIPIAIVGNPNYERYTIPNLSGNIAVKSTKQVYVSYFGTNGAATYGGYYSGFDTKPEIVTDKITVANSACIPNVVLKISTLSSYDTFQWYFNDNPIIGADTNSHTPTAPGFYQVKGSILSCPNTVPIFSDKIPVSDCPTNLDNDLANDNIDLDNDNDGVTNCTESYGNQNVDLSNQNGGNIVISNYFNSFTGIVTTAGTGVARGTYTGNSDGSFITEIPAGKENAVTYTLTFTKPLSVGMEYVTTGNTSDLLNTNAEYIVKSDINKTITVLNPDNQLLIDTNYDGIYESGITQHSSFEIRFRLNSTTALAPGTGTFKFLTYLVNTISFTHKNLSDNNPNKSTLKFFAICIPKDSDNDGVTDDLDTDSDNDGIQDTIEAQVNNWVSKSNTDTNNNGLDNTFETGLTPVDTDNDGVLDYLDLDSDNDGILDSVETGNDLDADGIKNYRDLDSDKDLCNDVIEAGFSDTNKDGILGSSVPPIVDVNGLVTSGIGYTTPNPNYITAAPIAITLQPNVAPTCELQNATITLVDNGGNTYQWELSTDGSTWNTITNTAEYSGVTTNTLLISSVKNIMNGYKYRVKLEKNGNSCGLISSETTLVIYAVPVVNTVTIVQCDDDIDGFSEFNLTVKNEQISSNATSETFTYYTSLDGAEKESSGQLIPNPLAFRNTTSGNMPIWTRVQNSNGCFKVTQINLLVSTTQIPTSFQKTFSNCDDLGVVNDDTDGVATFDFSSVTNDILTILPPPNTAYAIKYYKNEKDALAENNDITNVTNYRNEGYPHQQRIWVRVESTADNACYGLSPKITLIVNPKPNIDTNEDLKENELVCSNLPTFFVKLDSGIQEGSLVSDYTFIWSKDTAVLSNETKSTLDVNQEGVYTVQVSSLLGCSRTRTIKVTASDLAKITSVAVIDLSDINTITVNVSGQGQYEYSLDAPFGPFQESNLFNTVTAGIHEVFIKDKNGCGTVSQSVAVIGVPKFFTPNGDGQNDTWNVKGVNANFNENSIIYIYDRYGKLLKQIAASSQGWDGTFTGNPLPSDDYWYAIRLDDGREAKGHFSLKR